MTENSVKGLTEGYFKWRCRRGMKELDFILNRFVDAEYAGLSITELNTFSQLLDEEDMLLWYWLSGKKKPQDKDSGYANLVERICAAGYHK